MLIMLKYSISGLLASIAMFALIPIRSTSATSAYITRAGAVALMVESSEEGRSLAQWYRNGNMPNTPRFKDVRGNQWYDPYLEAAIDLGYIHDNQDNFRPGDKLNFAEARALFALAWQKNSPLFFLRDPSSEVTSIDALVEAYGISIPHTRNLFPRAHFYTFLRTLYGDNVAVHLPENAIIWQRNGDNRVVHIAPKPARRRAIEQQPLTNTISSQGSVMHYQTATVLPTPIQHYPTQQHPQPQQVHTSPNPFYAAVQQVAERVQSTTQTIAAPPPMQPHSTSFEIRLPTLGINSLPVIHPQDPFTHNGLLEVLKNGVGHLFSYPGWGGTVLIYGHSSSWPWDTSQYTKIFRRINELQYGDPVEIVYQGKRYIYRVIEHRTVPAKDMSSLQDEGGGEKLILYTCWPPKSTAERLLAIAEPVEVVSL